MISKYIIFFLLFIIVGCSNQNNTSITKETFDPAYKSYSSVLTDFVKAEKIDYLGLKKNRKNLDNYINQLAGISKKQLSEMSKNDQLAFWLNTYNGITLRSIIDNYPTKSIQDIKGVWTETKWYIAEQELTLDFIEHKIIRPVFKDARIHFAVNCASIGCPPLLNKPFTGQNVDSLLDVVSSLFVHNMPRHRIDFKNRRIEASELFTWFQEDFIRDFKEIKFKDATDVENAIMNFTYQYLNDSLKTEFSIDKHWEINFASYNWSLNDIER